MADQSSAALRWPAVFLTWWFEELAGLVPQALRPSSMMKTPCLILTLDHDDVVLLEKTARRGERELGRLDINDVDETANASTSPSDALAGLARRRYRKWPLSARLARHLGLRRQVELPLAARDDLSQLLHFELDRLTPFKADDVHMAWRIEDVDGEAGRMRVALEMAPRTAIDRAIAIAARYGRRVDRVELERHDGQGEPLDLLPSKITKETSGGRLNLALRLTTFALLIVVAVLPIKRQMDMIGGLETEITVLRAEAEESLALRQRLAALSNEATFLAGVDDDQTTMTELVAELTRLLPDHTHLQQLRITRTSMELNGLADEPSDLVAILDRSPLLRSPTFSAPITRDRRSSRDHFQISVQIPGSDS